jgi:hypothetical protein
VLGEQVELGHTQKRSTDLDTRFDLFSIAADVFGTGVRGSLVYTATLRHGECRNNNSETSSSLSGNTVLSTCDARTPDTSRDGNPAVTQIHRISSVTMTDGCRP